MNERRPTLGDTVYIPRVYALYEVRIKCPVCDGNLKVELILGNGDHEFVQCEYCRSGYNEPSGTINGYVMHNQIQSGVVTGIMRNEIEISGHTKIYESDMSDVFFSREDAERRLHEKIKETKEYEENRQERIFTQGKKSLTWRVGYYRKQISDAQSTIEYAERNLCRVQAKIDKRKK